MTAFNDVSWPVGAKEHRCAWCGEPIAKGEKHAHFVGTFDGEFQNWRMHYECYEDGTQGDVEDGFMPYEHERPK